MANKLIEIDKKELDVACQMVKEMRRNSFGVVVRQYCYITEIECALEEGYFDYYEGNYKFEINRNMKGYCDVDLFLVDVNDIVRHKSLAYINY